LGQLSKYTKNGEEHGRANPTRLWQLHERKTRLRLPKNEQKGPKTRGVFVFLTHLQLNE